MTDIYVSKKTLLTKDARAQAMIEIKNIDTQCENKLSVSQKKFLSEVIAHSPSLNIKDILDTLYSYSEEKYRTRKIADYMLQRMGMDNIDNAALMIDQFIFESYKRNFSKYNDVSIF